MTDLFKEKAADWDASQMRVQLSSAIGRAILANVALDQDMTVLDFGAGTGLLTSHVAPRVKSVTAVDISESMLEKLVEKTEFHGKVKPVCRDITRQPLNTRFDLVVSAMAMHHVEDTDHLLATFARHLAPGGFIALADLDSEDGSFHPPDTEGVHHHGFDRDALAASIGRNGFKDARFHTAHTVEKDGQRYSVFLVTARKA